MSISSDAGIQDEVSDNVPDDGPPGDIQQGGGGDILDFWTSSRPNILDGTGNADLDGPMGNPKGIRTTSDIADEGHCGPAMSAIAYTEADDSVTPVEMTGQVNTRDGISLTADSSEGHILAVGDPLADIFQGENGISYPDFEVELQPTSGVRHAESVQSNKTTLGAVQFGTVDGTLRTFQGTPVDGEPIIGDGFTTEAEHGSFEVLAPIGETFDLIVFNGTHEETINLTDPEQGLTLTYPELVVRVLGPDFSPVEEATVFVDQQIRRTNAAGEARLPRIGVTTVDIEVQGFYHTVESIPEPGISQVVQLTPDTLADWSVDGEEAEEYSALKLLVRDDFTGQPIRNCLVEVADTGIRDSTGMDGLVELMLPAPAQIADDDSDEEDLIPIVVSTAGDGRYIPETFEIEHPGTEVLETEISLSPTATTTDR